MPCLQNTCWCARSRRSCAGTWRDKVMGVVKAFCYFGEVADGEKGVKRTVCMGIAVACENLLYSCTTVESHCEYTYVNNRANICDASLHTALLYRAATWELTQQLQNSIRSCDPSDRISSAEIARRSRRLCLLRHVLKREEGKELAIIREWEVDGRRPWGHPRKPGARLSMTTRKN